MNIGQIIAVLALLSAFGVPQTTIGQIQNILEPVPIVQTVPADNVVVVPQTDPATIVSGDAPQEQSATSTIESPEDILSYYENNPIDYVTNMAYSVLTIHDGNITCQRVFEKMRNLIGGGVGDPVYSDCPAD